MRVDGVIKITRHTGDGYSGARAVTNNGGSWKLDSHSTTLNSVRQRVYTRYTLAAFNPLLSARLQALKLIPNWMYLQRPSRRSKRGCDSPDDHQIFQNKIPASLVLKSDVTVSWQCWEREHTR